MSSPDEYHSITKPARAEIKVKGSRFIGNASPVDTTLTADRRVVEVSRTYHGATHNCFAYRVIDDRRVIERASDAGEPAGTAGQPILRVLRGRGLHNIVLVVTRYFGGTKLGKGGLVRAYSDCAKAVLECCVIEIKHDLINITFSFPYDGIGSVTHVINQLNGKIVSSTYDSLVEMSIRLPRSREKEFQERIVEATSGKFKFM